MPKVRQETIFIRESFLLKAHTHTIPCAPHTFMIFQALSTHVITTVDVCLLFFLVQMTLNGAFFDVLHKYLLCQPLTVEARGGFFS